MTKPAEAIATVEQFRSCLLEPQFLSALAREIMNVPLVEVRPICPECGGLAVPCPKCGSCGPDALDALSAPPAVPEGAEHQWHGKGEIPLFKRKGAEDYLMRMWISLDLAVKAEVMGKFPMGLDPLIRFFRDFRGDMEPVADDRDVTVAALRAEIERLKGELATFRNDLEEAAGELMVPIPEPGTMTAKLLQANRILRHRCSNSLANNLCPDHRDKISGEECLKCQNERLQSRTITCIFCNTPCDSLAALKEHSATCVEHPAVKEVERMKEQLFDALRSMYGGLTLEKALEYVKANTRELQMLRSDVGYQRDELTYAREERDWLHVALLAVFSDSKICTPLEGFLKYRGGFDRCLDDLRKKLAQSATNATQLAERDREIERLKRVLLRETGSASKWRGTHYNSVPIGCEPDYSPRVGDTVADCTDIRRKPKTILAVDDDGLVRVPGNDAFWPPMIFHLVEPASAPAPSEGVEVPVFDARTAAHKSRWRLNDGELVEFIRYEPEVLAARCVFLTGDRMGTEGLWNIDGGCNPRFPEWAIVGRAPDITPAPPTSTIPAEEAVERVGQPVVSGEPRPAFRIAGPGEPCCTCWMCDNTLPDGRCRNCGKWPGPDRFSQEKQSPAQLNLSTAVLVPGVNQPEGEPNERS